MEHVGMVKNLSGDVQIQRKDAFIPVLPGLKLMDTDILITGAKGTAAPTMKDEMGKDTPGDSVLKISPCPAE